MSILFVNQGPYTTFITPENPELLGMLSQQYNLPIENNRLLWREGDNENIFKDFEVVYEPSEYWVPEDVREQIFKTLEPEQALISKIDIKLWERNLKIVGQEATTKLSDLFYIEDSIVKIRYPGALKIYFTVDDTQRNYFEYLPKYFGKGIRFVINYKGLRSKPKPKKSAPMRSTIRRSTIKYEEPPVEKIYKYLPEFVRVIVDNVTKVDKITISKGNLEFNNGYLELNLDIDLELHNPEIYAVNIYELLNDVTDILITPAVEIPDNVHKISISNFVGINNIPEYHSVTYLDIYDYMIKSQTYISTQDGLQRAVEDKLYNYAIIQTKFPNLETIIIPEYHIVDHTNLNPELNEILNTINKLEILTESYYGTLPKSVENIKKNLKLDNNTLKKSRALLRRAKSAVTKFETKIRNLFKHVPNVVRIYHELHIELI